MKDCKNKGWILCSLPVEIGPRGFVGRSLLKMCKVLGIYGNPIQ